MEFGVLGPLEVVEGDHRYSLGGPKQRAVLALLIAHAGMPVATGTLIDGLYGDEAPERAHRSIHTFVSNLRSELGDVIEPRGEGYIFVGERSSIDAFRFEDTVAAVGSSDDAEQTIERLQLALSLWRGLPYADIDVHTSLAAESTRLNELRIAAIEQRIDAELEVGRHGLLIAELEALTVEYPLRENFWAQQMVALYRAGRQAEALRTFDRARSTLVEETGLDPSAMLRDLEQRILQQDPALSLEARPTIRRMAVLAADVADPLSLTSLSPLQRDRLIERQTLAIGSAVVRHGGEVFAHRGTAMYAVFDDVPAAASSARDAQRDLVADDALMRIAVSVGDVEVRSGGEITGPPLQRAAALVGAAHGGQVLLAPEAHRVIAETGTAGWVIRSLGPHSFAGMSDAITVQQLIVEGVPDSFPPLQMSALPLTVPGASQGLPGYELREEIGSGVFGVVHRAYQPSVGREVSVKVIRPEFANHPDFIRRFEVEAQLVARLEHPHIVPLHDYWRDASGAFLVMRWVRGGSVADWLAEGPLDLFEINTILGQIVPALDYAHRNGVVHRDLKPSNILLDVDGNAYLTDFGIATDASQDRPTAASVDMRGLGHFIERCLAGGETAEPIAQYLAKVRSNGFADLTTMLDEWAEVSGATSLVEEIGFTSTRNPYKGLSAFGEADAADFHGRDDEISQLVAALGEGNLVAVVGPSGIGKSSVVRAGLLPALRNGALSGSGDWLIADMLPGAQPFEELATALLRVSATSVMGLEEELRRDARGLVRAAKRYLPDDTTLVLIVDQFEELFTLVDDDDLKRSFLELLLTATTDERSNVRVVLTMRADFFDLPLRFGDFGDLLRRSTVPIAAPTEADLRTIITAPAAAVGVEFESGLVERMVADVKDQPGALPLLEFSLAELFGEREADLIEIGAYEETGGVRGALGRRAELTFRALDDACREATRQVFLRLLTLPDAERVARRRVRVAELHRLGFEGSDMDGVVDSFRASRLLTADRDPITRGPTIDVAHEAIFAAWERLAGWIEERRSDLRDRGRLLEATDDWEESGREDALLLSGSRLGQLESWSKATDLSIGDAERELIIDSAARRESDTAGRRRTRRRVLAGFAAAAVLASTFGGIASVQRSSAAEAGDIARARELAALAVAQLEVDPEQSVLLALEAVELGRTTGIESLETTTALRRSLAANRVMDRFDGGSFVAVSPDGELIATGAADGAVIVREQETGEVVANLLRPNGLAIGAEFAPSGDQLAVYYAADDTPIWVWDVADKTSLPLVGPSTTGATAPAFLSFDGQGLTVAAYVGDEVSVWSTDDGVLSYPIDLQGDPEFIPGSDQLLVADKIKRELSVFDGATGLLVNSFPVVLEPQSFATSPEGDVVVIASQEDAGVAAYEIGTGALIWQSATDRVFGVEWVHGGAEVAVGSDGGRVFFFDGATGETSFTLQGGHVGIVWALDAVAGTSLLVTSGETDHTTITWDLAAGPIPELARLDTGAPLVRFVGFSPSLDRLFISENADPKTARILDSVTLDTLIDIRDPVVGNSGLETRLVGDGSLFATITNDGQSFLSDTGTNKKLYIAPADMFVREASYDGRLALIAPDPGTDDPPPHPPQIIEVATGDVVADIDKPELYLPWFSPDGSLLWDFNLAGDVRMFDSGTGRLALTIPRAWSVRPMPDGETISVIDDSGTLWHADLNALLEGSTLEQAALWSGFASQGFVSPLGHVANADGSLVSTTSRGDPVRIWDTATGLEVAVLDTGLTKGVPHVFFRPDESYVTVLSDGGILLTYALDTDELVEIARRRVTRSLTDAECQTFLHVDSCPDLGK